jgi:nucleoside-diphosphate-sugar epimerase
MKVLVAGGTGLAGSLVSSKLADGGITTDVLAIREKGDRKKVSALRKKVNRIYAYDRKGIEKVLGNGYDVIVNMMQKKPAETANRNEMNKFNKKITEEFVEFLRKSGDKPFLIHISSTRTYGPTQDKKPPISTSVEPVPASDYSIMLLKNEHMVEELDSKYCILRLSDILYTENDFPERLLEELFEYPLEARNEVITDSDASTAIANAVKRVCEGMKFEKQMYNIAGGAKNGWQSHNERILTILFSAMGVGMLDKGCFSKDISNFELDWYDTAISNELFDYQKTDIREYIEKMKKNAEAGGLVVKYMAPRIKSKMESRSPYLK